MNKFTYHPEFGFMYEGKVLSEADMLALSHAVAAGGQLEPMIYQFQEPSARWNPTAFTLACEALHHGSLRNFASANTVADAALCLSVD